MADPFEAARNGDTFLIGRFLDKTADKDLTDAHGFTTFHWASQFGNIEVLHMLKERGVDIGKTNDSGDSALHIATTFGQRETVKLLLEWGLDVNGTNEHGNTPLHYACFWRNQALAEDLLAAGAQLRRLNKYRNEPLDRVSDADKEALTELAKSLGAGIEVVPYKEENNHGRELVHVKYVKLELPAENLEVSDQLLGKGLYSETVLGKWKGGDVAVRKLKFSERMSENLCKQWFEEADHIRNLDKPVGSVLPLFGVVNLNGVWAVVSHYAPRGNLKQVIGNTNLDLDNERLYRMGASIAKGMKYLHELENPIPYLWLRPSMCVVDARFNVLLNTSDAGYSFNSTFFPVTRDPAYMAPEVLEDFSLHSRMSDVFSFGVILNEMFSRCAPYEGSNPMVVGMKVLTMAIRPEIDEDVTPNHIQKLVQLCWNTEAEMRPAFEDVCKIFEKLLAG